MTWRVPLAEVSFGDEERYAVQKVLESGWVSMGPETERFESEFAQYMGVQHAVAVSSGTAGLHLALMALGIGPGDEVIVPSLTFVASANAVRYVGATPVFADITSMTDWNISPDDIEEKIGPRTRAIIVVHYGGFPCSMDRILSIAGQHGLKVIEDAAHAPGGSFKGKKLGTCGDIGCLSFFANKNMTTAEGGMALTDDDDLAATLRLLRSHGMTALTWDRHRGHSFSYDVTRCGYNYRIDEMRSALGRLQLSNLEENNEKRRDLTARMRNLLRGADGISIPFLHGDLASSACHIFPIVLDSPDRRPSFMRFMKDHGIQTSIHYPPTHLFSAYRDCRAAGLSLTEDVASREVTLPLFPTMSLEQVEIVSANAIAAYRSG